MAEAAKPRILIDVRTVFIDGERIGPIETAIEMRPELRSEIVAAWKAELLKLRGFN